MSRFYCSTPFALDDGYGTHMVLFSNQRQSDGDGWVDAHDFSDACQQWRISNGDPDGLCNYRFGLAN